MRPIIAFDRVSADGYFASADGKLDWVVPDEEFDNSAGDSIGEGGADTILFGRTTYQMFESFWPNALKESQNGEGADDPHRPGRKSPAMRAMAEFINSAKKIVWSHTLKNVTWENSQLIRNFDPREIEAMKKAPGKAMMIFGSGSIVSKLTEHGLIDEYHFIVNPVILGDGKKLITDVHDCKRVKLVESKAYPSGNVLLRFARLA